MLEARRFQQAFGALLADTPPGIDPALQRALAVHRNTATKAASDALAANYPVCGALVGAEAFGAVAAAFVEAHAPDDPRLCFYGEGFAGFLAGWPPFAALPYLPAVAHVERQVTLALFAADVDALDAASLAHGVDPEAPLAMHPAASVSMLDWPAASLWRAHQPDAAADALDHVAWEPEIVLVSRVDATVLVTPIDRASAAFLSAPTLGEAAVASSEAGGDVATVFATVLAASALVQPSHPGATR